ncbi:hypothetical protein, partial [Bacteroides thetaiotaomicron]|uniref:hypothetical protein n=1 Tax=Bacteroides thetaiotaomicron TaxID=818 RepID=UPI001CE2DC55
DTSRQTKNLNKLLIRILLHLQVEFSSVFQSFYIFVLAVRPDLPAYCSAKVTDNSCTLQILTACGGRRKSSFSGRSVFLSPDLSGCRYHFRGAEK